jgi:hypothetical protein
MGFSKEQIDATRLPGCYPEGWPSHFGDTERMRHRCGEIAATMKRLVRLINAAKGAIDYAKQYERNAERLAEKKAANDMKKLAAGRLLMLEKMYWLHLEEYREIEAAFRAIGRNPRPADELPGQPRYDGDLSAVDYTTPPPAESAVELDDMPVDTDGDYEI